MEFEVFMSEWFRTTHITRKRMIHEQLAELNESGCRLELTVAEQASMAGMELMKRTLYQNRGGNDW